jgi:hypothetical protein
VEYMGAVHLLICRQPELLQILNEEHQLCHQELKNEGITQPTFDAGDLVIVKKQVKSCMADGIAAKIVFKSQGPYWVLKPANPGSCWIQKLPFLEGLGIPGKCVKESTARMENISSMTHMVCIDATAPCRLPARMLLGCARVWGIPASSRIE